MIYLVLPDTSRVCGKSVDVMVIKDTPLHKAAYRGEIDNIPEGTDVNVRGAQNRTPLHRAAGAGHPDCCDVLIEARANINIQDSTGRTPLHWASIAGRADICDLLLEAGCSVDMTTNAGSTPLHMSSEQGKTDVVEVLVKHGADQTIPDGSAEAAWAWDLAKRNHRKEVLVILDKPPHAQSNCCVIL